MRTIKSLGLSPSWLNCSHLNSKPVRKCCTSDGYKLIISILTRFSLRTYSHSHPYSWSEDIMRSLFTYYVILSRASGFVEFPHKYWILDKCLVSWKPTIYKMILCSLVTVWVINNHENTVHWIWGEFSILHSFIMCNSAWLRVNKTMTSYRTHDVIHRTYQFWYSFITDKLSFINITKLAGQCITTRVLVTTLGEH